jgi:hypothetical protein
VGKGSVTGMFEGRRMVKFCMHYGCVGSQANEHLKINLHDLIYKLCIVHFIIFVSVSIHSFTALPTSTSNRT